MECEIEPSENLNHFYFYFFFPVKLNLQTFSIISPNCDIFTCSFCHIETFSNIQRQFQMNNVENELLAIFLRVSSS